MHSNEMCYNLPVGKGHALEEFSQGRVNGEVRHARLAKMISLTGLFVDSVEVVALLRGVLAVRRRHHEVSAVDDLRLQPVCPRCSCSRGPTRADHPTGKMDSYTLKPCVRLCWSRLYHRVGRWWGCVWRCGFTHPQRSVLQAVSQAAKRIQTGHLQSVHINQEVNGHTEYFTSENMKNAIIALSCHTTSTHV